MYLLLGALHLAVEICACCSSCWCNQLHAVSSSIAAAIGVVVNLLHMAFGHVLGPQAVGRRPKASRYVPASSGPTGPTSSASSVATSSNTTIPSRDTIVSSIIDINFSCGVDKIKQKQGLRAKITETPCTVFWNISCKMSKNGPKRPLFSENMAKIGVF